MLASALSATLLGLSSAGHCAGMCGGISVAMGVAPGAKIPRIAGYHVGRVGSYAVAGAMAGSVGALLGAGSVGHSHTWFLRALAGIVLWFAAAQQLGWTTGIHLPWIDRWWGRIASLASPLLPSEDAPNGSFLRGMALGLLWGWLPCGSVYTALVLSLAAGSALWGASLMLLFGLGTVPVLSLLSFFASRVGPFARRREVRIAAALALFVSGAANFSVAARAANSELHGLPADSAHCGGAH